MTNIINPSAFLRQQRQYPSDQDGLLRELDKTYVDVSTAINYRTIGLYPTTKPALSGENWYFTNNEERQGLRQIYTFTSFADIQHNIDTTNVTFTNCSGSYTDATNWYGLIFGTSTGISGQVLFYIDDTFIYFVEDGSQPAITSGFVVLEWIAAT